MGSLLRLVPSGLSQVHNIPCPTGTKFVILLSSLAPSQTFREIYFGLSVFVRLGLPIMVTAVGTTLLVTFLQRRKKVRNKMLSEVPAITKSELKSEQLDSLTTCLITVALFYFILIMPGTILGIFDATQVKSLLTGRKGPCVFSKAVQVVHFLQLTNSSVNFLIYYWKLSSFRNAVRKTVFGCVSTKQSAESHFGASDDVQNRE